MSLPNYLAKIKSSGVYRYVFDKSIVPAQTAETLRLVVGYSPKGPFNTPVYIDNKSDFISIYGNINKRLEKKGVFFHRSAMQALSNGPILALNIKPFTDEKVNYISLDPWTSFSSVDEIMSEVNVDKLYDTTRFWKLDEDQLVSKLSQEGNEKYIYITATDTKDSSCTLFIRPCKPTAYDITINDWYNNMSDMEMPSYLDPYTDRKLNDFFAQIYVFKGEFTEELMNSNSMSKYFENGKLRDSYTNAFGESLDVLDTMMGDANTKFVAKYEGCLLPYFKDGNGNYISLDILMNTDYNSHNLLMKINDNIVDDILEKHFNDDENASFIENSSKTPIYIKGYDYISVTKDTTADDIQKKVLVDMMMLDKGIYCALTNRVDCEYHYIVDTFSTLLANQAYTYKSSLSTIAKIKDNAFALINFPDMALFTSNPNCISDVTGKFDMELIKNVYNVPTENDGASWCALYTSVILSDGTVKTTIPSAALVSNLYMEKWNSRQPYYIVAGPNYGRIQENGLVGPDYNYSRPDLDVLEPMGVNAIIYVPRKGTYINSNQTAKQVPVTALSKAHVRELVIYLQDEIEMMLQNYQWELNTSALRDTIKTKADAILERIAANGGVYAYENICDESNNTPEVIDNEMIILDTAIEPARGAGKMVQRLTIHKTGGISSLK